MGKVGELVEKPHIIRAAGSLELWKCESCKAVFGVGDNWATLYFIKSEEEGKGHATALILATQKYYEGKGLVFGGSVALNMRMRRLYHKCGIREYT